jgi:hypothetical protein
METKMSASIPSDVEMPCKENTSQTGIQGWLLLLSHGLNSMINPIYEPFVYYFSYYYYYNHDIGYAFWTGYHWA